MSTQGRVRIGTLVRFLLLPGQRPDNFGIEPWITGIDFGARLGDSVVSLIALR